MWIGTILLVVLCHDLLSQLNVLGISVRLTCASVDNLLPLVVLGLALSMCQLCLPNLVTQIVYSRIGSQRCFEGETTYGQIEHAGLLCGGEVLALCDLGVCVELEKHDGQR